MSTDQIAVAVAFWAVLGAGLVVLAVLSVRRRRARGEEDPRLARMGSALTLAAIYVALGLVVPGVVIAVGTRMDESTASGQELTPAQVDGRRAFSLSCAGCHTLAASNAAGVAGPSLDAMRPSVELVLDAIANGRARGNGQMPADLLSGDAARDVAEYVAAVAGR
ncbi:MAG TPA: cytochrome c [Capillimicrobium sp.]|nr:cytochrome c [Capillimicrobium sp.]